MAKRTQRNLDYVKYGSDRHAAMLNLRKADDDDKLKRDDWTLEDVTMYGAQVTDEFLFQTLKQRVNELTAEHPVMQSDDPFVANYAPEIWRP